MMQSLRTGRGPVLASLAILGVWLVVWLAVLTPAAPAEHALWLSLALAPLLIVAVAVAFDRKGGYAWSGFLSLGYLAQGITEVWTDQHQWYTGAFEILLSLLLFAAASYALRIRRRTR